MFLWLVVVDIYDSENPVIFLSLNTVIRFILFVYRQTITSLMFCLLLNTIPCGFGNTIRFCLSLLYIFVILNAQVYCDKRVSLEAKSDNSWPPQFTKSFLAILSSRSIWMRLFTLSSNAINIVIEISRNRFTPFVIRSPSPF